MSAAAVPRAARMPPSPVTRRSSGASVRATRVRAQAINSSFWRNWIAARAFRNLARYWPIARWKRDFWKLVAAAGNGAGRPATERLGGAGAVEDARTAPLRSSRIRIRSPPRTVAVISARMTARTDGDSPSVLAVMREADLLCRGLRAQRHELATRDAEDESDDQGREAGGRRGPEGLHSGAFRSEE